MCNATRAYPLNTTTMAAVREEKFCKQRSDVGGMYVHLMKTERMMASSTLQCIHVARNLVLLLFRMLFSCLTSVE